MKYIYLLLITLSFNLYSYSDGIEVSPANFLLSYDLEMNLDDLDNKLGRCIIWQSGNGLLQKAFNSKINSATILPYYQGGTLGNYEELILLKNVRVISITTNFFNKRLLTDSEDTPIDISFNTDNFQTTIKESFRFPQYVKVVLEFSKIIFGRVKYDNNNGIWNNQEFTFFSGYDFILKEPLEFGDNTTSVNSWEMYSKHSQSRQNPQ